MVEILENRPHLFNSIPVAFLLTDAHSKILYANHPAGDLFGYGQNEMEGQRVRVLFLQEDLMFLLPNIIYLSLYQDGFKGELLLKQREGKKIFVHLHTHSFKEKGETYITFSFQEIQRLKNLEHKRLDDEHWVRVGRMIEEIAHQIRNPVTSIGRYTHRLLKGIRLPRAGESCLTRIMSEAKRLEKIIQYLEDFIEVRNLSFQKEKVQEVTEEALRLFSKRANVKGLLIRLGTGGIKGDGSFFINRESLVKALLNLLENSLDAVTGAPRKKRKAMIGIDLSEDREMVRIAISDNGQGVRKRHFHEIFEPFFTTRSDRAGLGLPFVKRIMEVHGGEIQVKSQLKKGTTITLYFFKDRRRRVRREFLSPVAESIGGLSL